jgi:hypothetical protein
MQYSIFIKKSFKKINGSGVGSTKKEGKRKEEQESGQVGISKEEGEKKKLGVKEQYLAKVSSMVIL